MSDVLECVLKAPNFAGFDAEGNRKTYVKGDTVLLTKAQFESFSDMFELKSRQAAESSMEDDDFEVEDDNDADSEVEDD